MEPKKEIGQLREEVRFHLHRYHVLDDPEIPDIEFDALFDRLVQLEQANPDLVVSDSPTQRVGAEPSAEFDEVVHSAPMLSLDKCVSGDEIQAWQDRCARILGEDVSSYVCEPKIDGVAVNLLYEDGVLARGATRGNGEIGEDIRATSVPSTRSHCVYWAMTSLDLSKSVARYTCLLPDFMRTTLVR